MIEFLNILRNEVKAQGIPDVRVQLDFNLICRHFIRYRRVKLLRYLFSLRFEFEFNVEVFILALEEDAYEIATLLY